FCSLAQGGEVGGTGEKITAPWTKQLATVDQIDGEPILFVLIGKVAPEIIVWPHSPQGLKREGDQAPRPKAVVVVAGVLDMNLYSRAELACVLVKRRLEPTVPQPSTMHPTGREGFHFCHYSARLEIRRAEQLQWTRRAAPLGKSGAFQHHRSGVASRHPQIGCVRARIYPCALAE